MAENKQVALSVRIDEKLYTEFKVQLLRDKTSVQKFLAKAVAEYVDKKKANTD